MKENNKHISSKTSDLPEGFYYAREDYAGLLKRFAILFIDSVVILFVSLIFIVLFSGIFNLADDPTPVILFLLLISYIYLTLMKRTWGTVGYWITGVQIVDLEGEEPSMWDMTIRYLLLVLGPINLLFDLFWLCSDENKQTLRDKIAATYVIKRNAMPLGYGQQKFTPYFIGGYSFSFKEVKRSTAG